MLFLHSIFSLSLGCCTGFLQPIVQVTKVSAGLQKSKLDCLAFFCEQWLLGCSVEYHNMGALEVLGNYRLYTHWVWGSTHSGANILELSHEGLSTLTPLINMRTMKEWLAAEVLMAGHYDLSCTERRLNTVSSVTLSSYTRGRKQRSAEPKFLRQFDRQFDNLTMADVYTFWLSLFTLFHLCILFA